jgi:hypothetical protein
MSPFFLANQREFASLQDESPPKNDLFDDTLGNNIQFSFRKSAQNGII